MERVSLDHLQALPATPPLLAIDDFVLTMSHAMRSIAQMYATALDDPRLDAEMLIGLLYLGPGSTLLELVPGLGFAVCNPEQVLHQLMSAGFVSTESEGLIRPTAEAQSAFRRLALLAQKENQRWREQLRDMPGGQIVLDDFLMMLQTSENT